MPGSGRREALRTWITDAFTSVEDIVYIGLGTLLAAIALALLVVGTVDFVRAVLEGDLAARVIALLDGILLIVMIVEILYTVQVSFREHTLAPEPFLVVGLIAATRRVLVLTAEFPILLEKGNEPFRNALLELGLLTVMIVALVISVVILRRGTTATAER